jgi:peptidyl-dipeptidase Dcp
LSEGSQRSLNIFQIFDSLLLPGSHCLTPDDESGDGDLRSLERRQENPGFSGCAKEMAPKLAAIEDEIKQNSRLFQCIETVYRDPATTVLNHEQQRLVGLDHMHFVLAGARLDQVQKKRVAGINQELASLYTQFSQNELADEENDALILDKKEDLVGLPASVVGAAAAEADRRKMPGKWIIANTRSAMQPFLTYSAKRDLREKAFKIWTSRGDNDNAHNNNKVVSADMQGIVDKRGPEFGTSIPTRGRERMRVR